MCLGVPGKVIEVGPEQEGLPMGRVQFGAIAREVCLAYTPEVEVGEYVLVHAGFSIGRLDEAEAQEIFTYLDEIERLGGEGAPEREPS